MTRALAVIALLALAPLGDAAAQIGYGQCQDRARDRLMRNQVNPAIGRDRALDAYTADIRDCQRMDAQNRASDTRTDQQRLEDQRLDHQRLDQQRLDQQRLDQQRTRQRDDMYRNRR